MFFTACPIDTYKPALSNITCHACPQQSSTLHHVGSSTCHCSKPDTYMTAGQCVTQGKIC